MTYQPGSKDHPSCRENEVFLAYIFNADEVFTLGYATARIDLAYAPTDDEGNPLQVQYAVFVSEDEWKQKNA